MVPVVDSTDYRSSPSVVVESSRALCCSTVYWVECRIYYMSSFLGVQSLLCASHFFRELNFWLSHYRMASGILPWHSHLTDCCHVHSVDQALF